MVPTVAPARGATALLPLARRPRTGAPPERAAALPRGLTARTAGLGDPLVRPLLDGLAAEYRDVLGHPADAVERELAAHPASDFEEPSGCLLLLLDAGTPVAGGAYRRFGAAPPGASGSTAELKRIWTAPTHRRLGLARRVVAELEARAAAAGYARIHLTTGVHQHAAQRLYRAGGYTEGGPLPGPGATPVLAFSKYLPA